MELSPRKTVDVESSFSRQTMMETLGATLVKLTPGQVVIQAPILPGARQQQGFGHAGLTFSLGDSAAGYSALTLLPEGAEVLTAEMKINLLAPARGEMLRAVGEVVKPGRRLVIVRATVWAIEGERETEIALLQGTIVPV